jgi:glycosyltransferase involved in cell wall biosynthesis
MSSLTANLPHGIARPRGPGRRAGKARGLLAGVRVIFLSHYYPPEAGAPQARISAVAHGLVARGHRVTVHTGFPHYPTGRIIPPYRNGLMRAECEGALRVVRSAVVPAPNRGFARRLADHAAFAVSSLATSRWSGPADVVVAESPPLFLAGAAVGYARGKRAPLVINVADRWPASAVQLGALSNPLAIRAAEILEALCYREATALTAPTAGIVAALERHPHAAGKARLVAPGVDLERFDSDPPADEGPLRVLYAGTVGLAQGIDVLIDAARAAGPDVVQVRIAGGGAEINEIDEQLQRGGVTNVRLLGIVPHTDVPGLYAEADVGVVLLRDRPIFEGAVPTKLLEAMAAGRPVVLGARGEAARLVEEAGAGLVVPPEDPEALARAFRELAGDRPRRLRLGAAGRRWVCDRHARDHAVDRWEQVLVEAAGGGLSAPWSGRGPAARHRAG